MAKLKITLIKGTSNSLKKHQLTVQALGLRKISQVVEQEDNAAIRGMIQKVRHLVKVEKA
ncbi:50S ribosomal protein L30 [Amygdalobacter indicium]|jgi:ribosomal protein L30|uniref:Large ribosomal subunit protein uL30 n=1 Tax=Amygdalobacter indicium TaxID=3029272 RepID=A0ABY8CAI9_9FIRM|nr:50S ribosomal protein L30 [Amygdalobacter indicium]WEG34243.1 50S ribosomal protein L30 [Amygdalobacter indicium]WEG35825.1 50S ribosomal protein L30 [Amygdalobacter indicium]